MSGKRRTRTRDILSSHSFPSCSATAATRRARPKNTMASFRAAVEAGVPGVELDSTSARAENSWSCTITT
jgi:hypothetical protein